MAKSREQLRKSLLTKSEWNNLLLERAYKNDKAGVVEALDYGADIKAVNSYGETALHNAAINGDMTLTAILIGRGADLTTKDKIGLTPEEWATKNGHHRLMEMFNRRKERLETPHPQRSAEAESSQHSQPDQSNLPREASSTGSAIPDVLYNMGRFAYDSGLAGAIGKAALNVGQFMHDTGLGTMIGKALINNRINAYKRNIWLTQKAVGIGSYLFNSWLGANPSNPSSETADLSKPIKFINKGAILEQDEIWISSGVEDRNIFYHVGNKEIPIKVSDKPGQGISQSVYNKILAQLEKLKKLDLMKSTILEKIASLKGAHKSEEEIIEEIKNTTGIKLSPEDLRGTKKLDEKITEEVKNFYILEKCNEVKLKILQKMADLYKANQSSPNPLFAEDLQKKIIEEIDQNYGIRFTAEEFDNSEKFDQKIAKETIKSEMQANLNPEEQEHIFRFAENYEKPSAVDIHTDKKTPDLMDAETSRAPELKKLNYKLLIAALEGNLEDIEDAIAKGADINFQSEQDGFTVLHLAVKNPYLLEALPRLLELGADPKIKDKEGDLPVHKACKADENGFVYALLEKDLETLNIPNNEGLTPLDFAASSTDPTMLTIMFELADDNAKAASENLDIKKVELELNRQGLEGHSPLHIAALSNCPDNIKLLCARGANVNLQDESGNTALDIALNSKRQEMKDITMLLELVPNDKEVLNSKNLGGDTLLHKAAKYAAISDDMTLYNKLQENGANPLVANDEGIFPQQIIMNYAINADKRKMETSRIEDGKTRHQLDDLLPVYVALGDRTLIEKALVVDRSAGDLSRPDLLVALGSANLSELNKIREKAAKYFVPSDGSSSNVVALRSSDVGQGRG